MSNQKRYFAVTGHVTISVTTYVRADSPKDAIRIARNRDIQGLPIGTDGYPCEEWSTFGDLDGQPVPTGAVHEIDPSVWAEYSDDEDADDE